MMGGNPILLISRGRCFAGEQETWSAFILGSQDGSPGVVSAPTELRTADKYEVPNFEFASHATNRQKRMALDAREWALARLHARRSSMAAYQRDYTII